MNITEKVYTNVRENFGMAPFENSLLIDSIILATVLECARLVDSFPDIPNEKVAQFLRNVIK
jgi:hypothetical protein